MRTKNSSRKMHFRLTLALCAAFTVIGYVLFTDTGTRYAALLAGAVMIFLLATGELSLLRAPAALLLLGYVVFSGLGAAWAIAGKFFLREYMKIFIACAFFLYVMLKKRVDRDFARRVMTIISGSAAIYAFLSVEAATTGLMKAVMNKIPTVAGLPVGFQSGSRLSGVFCNSNIEATVYALGILLSVALLCGAKDRRERSFSAVALAFCAYAFLLVFSMGATACFALSIVVYLIFAGRGRSAALLRMLEGAVPTLLCVFLAFPFFNRGGSLGVLPLLIMLLDAAAAVFLELRFTDKLLGVLDAHSKLAFGALIGVVALVAVYVAAGFNLTGAYTFGNGIQRGVYPEAGEHTLVIDADGPVTVGITTQNRAEAMMLTTSSAYSGDADGARFTVPEGTLVTFFYFTAEPGTTLRSATIDGTEKIPLRYLLLPAFAASRIQGVRYGQTAIQRTVYFSDALKLWRLSPIGGLGVGAFETGVTRVQQFFYETRYVHNHYLQILLESGVIGFALWVGALLAMVLALWKRRRESADWEFQAIYPALCAALVMLAAQTFVDVSLSYIHVLCWAYALFALIVRCCAPAAEAAPASAKAKKGARGKRTDFALFGRIFAVILPAAFMLTVYGNLRAVSIANSPAATLDAYLANIALAAKVDVYEYNDYKLAYINTVVQEGSLTYLDEANRYAAEMAQVQSNSIPSFLVAYYLNTQQYGAAVDEAIQAARLSASNHNVWNANIDMLRQAFMDNPYSPLLTDHETLLPKLYVYRDMLYERNATAMETIRLTERSTEFFVFLGNLADCGGDPEKIAGVIGFWALS